MSDKFKKIFFNSLLPLTLFIAVLLVLNGDLDYFLIYLDSERFTFLIGDFKFSIYSIVKAILLFWFYSQQQI